MGNLASGFWRGTAVGGSVGRPLNVAAGGRTRWAAIWSGIWLLVILALFSGLVAKIVVPTLAATLLLPVAAAVGIGVALSLLLQLNQEALDVTMVQLVPRADGRFESREPPAVLTGSAVTILDVYGSLIGESTWAAYLDAEAWLVKSASGG